MNSSTTKIVKIKLVRIIKENIMATDFLTPRIYHFSSIEMDLYKHYAFYQIQYIHVCNCNCHFS